MPTPGKREASASSSQSAVIPARVSGTLIRIGEDQFARARGHGHRGRIGVSRYERWHDGNIDDAQSLHPAHAQPRIDERSEENTSELQSLMRNSDDVFCL